MASQRRIVALTVGEINNTHSLENKKKVDLFMRPYCSIVLMETIPEDLQQHLNARPNLPLFVGFHTLLDQAKHSIQVVSPVWNLRPSEKEPVQSTGRQV